MASETKTIRFTVDAPHILNIVADDYAARGGPIGILVALKMIHDRLHEIAEHAAHLNDAGLNKMLREMGVTAPAPSTDSQSVTLEDSNG